MYNDILRCIRVPIVATETQQYIPFYCCWRSLHMAAKNINV
jgi:hypothetical protein